MSSEFNNPELDMDKLESHIWKEAAWRSRLQRHARSGKSIAAFCRDEAVSMASFHIWRPSLPLLTESAQARNDGLGERRE
jgi:hypothetical protein